MTDEMKKEAALLLYENILSNLSSSSSPNHFSYDTAEEYKTEVRAKQFKVINKLISKLNAIQTEFPALFSIE